MSGQGTSCSGGPRLIFACSGCADVGEVADRAARKMTKAGIGKMFCLAGIGGRVPGIMKMTESASMILAVDGCELDCVKKCLNLAGFEKSCKFVSPIWVWRRDRRRSPTATSRSSPVPSIRC